MATKLKLKKKFKFTLLFIIIGIILIIYGLNKYSTYLYEQSYEFKFLEIGYSLEEIEILENNFSDEKLNSLLETDKDEIIFEILASKYYIKEHYDEYYNYLAENNNLSTTEVISIINTNTDEFFYEDVTSSDLTDGDLILVNKYNSLDENYVPDDLVTISTKYSWGSYGSQQCFSHVYDAFLDMWSDANEEDIYLMINSSYRSFDEQDDVYNSYLDSKGERYADSIAARAGHSEHQTGLALDIFSKDYSSMSNFYDSPDYNWLVDNAHKYGFIIRYTENDEDLTGYSFESWHYRYVGKDVATYIYNSNITFDEYYEYYINY